MILLPLRPRLWREFSLWRPTSQVSNRGGQLARPPRHPRTVTGDGFQMNKSLKVNSNLFSGDSFQSYSTVYPKVGKQGALFPLVSSLLGHPGMQCSHILKWATGPTALHLWDQKEVQGPHKCTRHILEDGSKMSPLRFLTLGQLSIWVLRLYHKVRNARGGDNITRTQMAPI